MKFISTEMTNTSPSSTSSSHVDEPSSTVTYDAIAGRSWTAAFTWWLFRALVPFFLPAPVHLKGPQTFPDPPPIPASCVSDRWEYEGWTMSTISPHHQREGEDPSSTSRAMIYFHGGAFNHPVNKGHWEVAATFAEGLNAEVVLVPTPLAPDNTADEVRPDSYLRRLRWRELTRH